MTKKYRVTLSTAERDELTVLISNGKAAARKLAHARVLLQVDESVAKARSTDEQVAQALNLSRRTVERVRERFVEQGFAAALMPRSSTRRYARAFDGALDSAPVGGTSRRTADGRKGFPRDRASDTEKNELRPHLRKMWCIPPKQSAEFVYHMKDVLEVYQQPPDPQRPVVCLDETFQQLIGEVREPLPARPGEVERYDSVYLRNGVASIFVAFEPLVGWRHVAVTDSRRRGDWAHFVEDLLAGPYREAPTLVLVMDQLNTHSPASFYEAFAPDKAKRLADRLEIHYTPKHGSWLNMAEIELSVLARDLPERIGGRTALEQHVSAWEQHRNRAGIKADWQFTTTDARIKLRKLYPTIEG